MLRPRFRSGRRPQHSTVQFGGFVALTYGLYSAFDTGGEMSLQVLSAAAAGKLA